jgi:methylated-DNA-[protein]-cysteine S-methyltransferase
VIETAVIDSPVGPLTLAAREGRVCLLSFAAADRADSAARSDSADRINGALLRWYPRESVRQVRDPAGAVRALADYFDGNLAALDAVPVELNGTPFQRRVWEALRRVPAGTTCSYRALAQRIAAPSAVRAVGAANGANPVAIIVPCHRVIGANGTLTGYGGGLERKRWLLEHEAAQRALFGDSGTGLTRDREIRGNPVRTDCS